MTLRGLPDTLGTASPGSWHGSHQQRDALAVAPRGLGGHSYVLSAEPGGVGRHGCPSTSVSPTAPAARRLHPCLWHQLAWGAAAYLAKAAFGSESLSRAWAAAMAST